MYILILTLNIATRIFETIMVYRAYIMLVYADTEVHITGINN